MFSKGQPIMLSSMSLMPKASWISQKSEHPGTRDSQAVRPFWGHLSLDKSIFILMQPDWALFCLWMSLQRDAMASSSTRISPSPTPVPLLGWFPIIPPRPLGRIWHCITPTSELVAGNAVNFVAAIVGTQVRNRGEYIYSTEIKFFQPALPEYLLYKEH